jgi:transposase
LEIIDQLRKRVQELEARLAKDSQSSHLPLSSDRFKRQPKSLRTKGEKPSGGQKGHLGKHLMMVQPPDHVITHTPTVCPSCQQDVSQQPSERIVRRQVRSLMCQFLP